MMHEVKLSCYSSSINFQIGRIYEKLTETFEDPLPTTDQVNQALEAMELIAPLPDNDVTQRSYHLFQIIIQAPISLACSEERKWKASCLAMHGAYKCDRLLPSVEDPHGIHKIFAFLEHYFDLATTPDQYQDEPIQDALCALSYASRPSVIEVLKHVNLTNPSFIRGICHIFQDNQPPQLHTVALLFFALISDKWFDSDIAMGPGDMRNFCAGWASAVDSAKPTERVQEATETVFLRIIGSPHWCCHTPMGKWGLLKNFTPAPGDPQFSRCIKNPELMQEIEDTDDPVLVTHWLKILWLNYKELAPEVQIQLEKTMEELVDCGRKADCVVCLSLVKSELKKADQYSTSIKESLEEAKNTLTALISS